MQQTEMDLLQ